MNHHSFLIFPKFSLSHFYPNHICLFIHTQHRDEILHHFKFLEYKYLFLIDLLALLFITRYTHYGATISLLISHIINPSKEFKIVIFNPFSHIKEFLKRLGLSILKISTKTFLFYKSFACCLSTFLFPIWQAETIGTNGIIKIPNLDESVIRGAVRWRELFSTWDVVSSFQ